jgi:hypothetical protein
MVSSRPDHHRAVRHEGGDQQQQEPVRERARAPVPVAQHAMVHGEAGRLAEAHDPQRAATVRRPGASRVPQTSTST